MSKVLRETRARVYQRDGHVCRYCGRAVMVRDDQAPNMATVDHVVPKVKGGSNRFHNLVTACFPCNQAKGEAEPLEFTPIEATA